MATRLKDPKDLPAAGLDLGSSLVGKKQNLDPLEKIPIDQIPELPVAKSDVNIFDLGKLFIIESLKTLTILNLKGGGKMDLKNFFVGMVSRWIFKIAGGALMYAGITTADGLFPLIGGAVSILIGIITSLVQHKRAIETDPVSLK